MTPKQLFSLLSDATRARLIVLIAKKGELCVCDLTQITEESQPKISRHLALMRTGGLVADLRRGQWVYYRLHSDLEPWAIRLIEQIANELVAMEPHRSDLKAVKGCC